MCTEVTQCVCVCVAIVRSVDNMYPLAVVREHGVHVYSTGAKCFENVD